MEDPSVLQDMQTEARKEGVQWDDKNMKTVDWTAKECENLQGKRGYFLYEYEYLIMNDCKCLLCYLQSSDGQVR